VSEKIKKSIKLKKLKKIIEKPNHEKKPIRIFKNQPVWFGFDFISLKQKKLNRTKTGKKPSQTGFCSKITELNRNRLVLVFFK
jgi:hypothetical protein